MKSGFLREGLFFSLIPFFHFFPSFLPPSISLFLSFQIFVYLAVPVLSCGKQAVQSLLHHVGDLQLWHSGSSSLAPCTGSTELQPLDRKGNPDWDFLMLFLCHFQDWLCMCGSWTWPCLHLEDESGELELGAHWAGPYLSTLVGAPDPEAPGT